MIPVGITLNMVFIFLLLSSKAVILTRHLYENTYCQHFQENYFSPFIISLDILFL